MSAIEPSLVPVPTTCSFADAPPFRPDASIAVSAPDGAVAAAADRLGETLAATFGVEVGPVRGHFDRAAVRFEITADAPTGGVDDEAYELAVSVDGITVRAATGDGAHRAVDTIRQLAGPDGIPAVEIRDAPRFPWRGMLLDCCRHFMTVDFVERVIDLLAYHRMNRFHWHLTEDQGWRLAIEEYPRLTEIGAWRGEDRYGGYYTRDDVRRVVEYAERRGIVVVPEIELPGHSLAALASYSELSCAGGPFEVPTRWGIFEDVYCAGNDRVFDFLQTVLTEVMALFPSCEIHIGGDECPKVRWAECPRCQARLKAEGLGGFDDLQSWFVRRIGEFLAGSGRRMIGWDEIMQGGLAPGAIVQAWHGHEPARIAAESGHDAIVSPTSHCYFDYPSEQIDLRKVYSFDPVPAGLEADAAARILGGECCMWTERAPQETVDGKVLPRICAFAEKLWSPVEAHDWDGFVARMRGHVGRLTTMGYRIGEDPSFP